MITVTVKRAYHGTHFGTDEKGVLRVWEGSEVVAEYAPGEDITVSQDGPLPECVPAGDFDFIGHPW